MNYYRKVENVIREFFNPGPAVRAGWAELPLDAQHSSQRRAGRIFGLLWLFYMVYPIGDLARGTFSTPQRIAGAIGLTIFIVVYLYAYFRRFYRQATPLQAWAPVGVLLLLLIGFTFGISDSWLGLMIYVVTATGSSVNAPIVVPTTVSLSALTIMLGMLTGSSFSDVSALAFEVLLVGVTMLFLRRLIATNAELRLAREENARLAVSEERLRFARDLHDLLGHSLSLIALKSELAGRLVEVSPERAQAEIHDIEQVTREALREVREAVSGYRQPDLNSELSGASATLEAAGIECRIENQITSPATPIEAALGWAVREGVTNVIRHSDASICRIELRESDQTLRLTVSDNGQGKPDTRRGGRIGTGIAGLTERIAALGGQVVAGPQPGGGFCLAVEIPFRQEAKQARTTRARETLDKGRLILGEQP